MRFDKTLDVERAMAIYAHPDDAEFGMAGTVAKWAKAGVEFTYYMDTNVDVSDVVDVKIKALLAHRSQIDADSVDFIKSWMKEAGRKKRYAYAEGFKVMRFEEDGAPRRDARREGRKAPQARGRRVSRSTTTSRPARRSR